MNFAATEAAFRSGWGVEFPVETADRSYRHAARKALKTAWIRAKMWTF